MPILGLSKMRKTKINKMEFIKKILNKFFGNKNSILSDKILKLESSINYVSSENSRLNQEIRSIKDSMWSLDRETKLEVNNLDNKFGWRKVVKKLPGWKNQCEFVELYAHVFVLDDGYKKTLAPYLVADSSGKREVLHKEFRQTWNGEYKMRCLMVTRLILPGYTKIEDLSANDSKNFTMEKLFGKSYQELVSYMSEYNYHKTSDGMYEISFYEL